ncbi:hypothetical protein GF324_05475 [bacterium]|nr:hypothetical protein [bacterium]
MPENPKFSYEYGNLLLKTGDEVDALPCIERAANMGHPLAIEQMKK